MTTPFIDTNIFLRHLTRDDPAKAEACFQLIQRIEQGTITAWTSELVIAELVFVLHKQYRLDRLTVRDLLLPLISLPGLKIAHKRMYRRVFDLFASGPVGYNDAYNAALMEFNKATEIYSYDAEFDRIEGITRKEP